MRVNENTEKLAIQSLFDYIKNFNKKDKNKILDCLHFPHVAQSGQNEPKVYKNKEEIWSYLGFLLKKLETEERLSGIIIYGCPYLYDKIKKTIHKSIPLAYSPSQIEEAQNQILSRILQSKTIQKEIDKKSSKEFTD